MTVMTAGTSRSILRLLGKSWALAEELFLGRTILMNAIPRLVSKHSLALPVLFAAALLITCSAQLYADKGYWISGCVTDGAGNPVVHAKVVARQVDGQHTGKAETKPLTGCYKVEHLPSGTYLVSLRDDRFAFDHIGPVQAKVDSTLEANHVDLSADPPDTNRLRDAVADALLSARDGYNMEEEAGVPMTSDWSNWGTGLPARIVPGFMKCTIHYRDAMEGPTAVDWCQSWGIRKDATAALYGRMGDAIRAAVGEFPGLRYDEQLEGGSGCADCTQETRWSSPINGAISLRLLVGPRSTYSIHMWLIYNRRLAAQGCASLQRGEGTPINSKAYAAESAKIVAGVQAAIRQQIAAEGRNLLRALITGGAQETVPTPGRLSTFPGNDASTNCFDELGKPRR
jgi:hypothetical protein